MYRTLSPLAGSSMKFLTRCATRRRWRWGNGNVEGDIAEIVEEGKAQVTSNKVSAWNLPLSCCIDLASSLRRGTRSLALRERGIPQ